MASWELLGTAPPLAPGGQRLAAVRRAGTRQEGWTWLGTPRAGAARIPGTEPGSEMRADRRVWGSRADAELRCHLGLLDDDGEIIDP
jgi:hypothetical protein